MFFRKIITIIKIVPAFQFYINIICKLKNIIIIYRYLKNSH